MLPIQRSGLLVLVAFILLLVLFSTLHSPSLPSHSISTYFTLGKISLHKDGSHDVSANGNNVSSSSKTIVEGQTQSQSLSTFDPNNLSRTLVIPSVKEEDTAWIRTQMQHLAPKIYVVNDKHAEYTVPVNKGREGMTYLTYIIDHYDQLPDISIFHHSQRVQWHEDGPGADSVEALRRLRLSYVMEQGYVNLRCSMICTGDPAPHEMEREYFDLVKQGQTPAPTYKYYMKRALEAIFPGREVPEHISIACCAQFAVSRDTILSNTREDYIRIRDWLINTELPDSESGRVMEYTWHMIFGVQANHCPNMRQCFCKVYGMCDLECDEGKGECKL